MTRVPLPIDAVMPEIVEGLCSAGTVVLLRRRERERRPVCRPRCWMPVWPSPGRSSCSSRDGWRPGPARRVAAERGGRPGDEIGYQVRFDRCTGPQTRIQVVTEGIFLRMLQDDPFLESVAVVVFDEFHERSIQSDLALAMVQRVRETARPDLKVVVMSATLDLGPIARYLRDCPVVESQGRLYPVAISYARDAENRPIADRAAEGVLRILDLTVGDVLVFLPGVSEIRQTSRRLESLGSQGMAVLPLYGDLPAEKQDQVLSPMGRRKVVLATNVAETSITIEGITGVVDMGLARSLVFDPHVGMDRLQLVRISQASADQRAGRAGRTGPGICLRMWPERSASRPARAG